MIQVSGLAAPPPTGRPITNLDFQFGRKVADQRDLVATVSRTGHIDIAIYDKFVALCKPMGTNLGLKLGVFWQRLRKVTHLRYDESDPQVTHDK
jgi:hypothetical protein